MKRRVSLSCVAACCLIGSCLSSLPAWAITIEWVRVGNAGNANDTTGYGAVATEFEIMKYEFTNQQYTDFLNSVAATDVYFLYNTSMGTNVRGGITRAGTSGSYTYSVRANMADKPVNYISWFDAARVANWLMNGATGASSTETGAYTLAAGQTSGTAPAANPGALFTIPTENQWYKAAYYNPTLNGGAGGYSVYGNGFDTVPAAVTANATGDGSAGGTGNFANYNNTASWNGAVGNVTTVGTNGAASYYGAFDMSGNITEWNDLNGTAGTTRGIRGGNRGSTAVADLSSSVGGSTDASVGIAINGFRFARPVPIPEPSQVAMAAVGLACVGWAACRRGRIGVRRA